MIEKSAQIERRLWQLAGLFIMLGLVLKLFAMQFVGVHGDSSYYLNIASNFIERGELTPYMWRLGADTNIIAGSGTGYGILVLNYWFKVVGLSLLSGYIFMYLVGLLSLVVVYFLARDWWGGEAAGIGAAVFMALTGSFASHFYIRMDAPAILAYSLILWLHLRAVRSGRPMLHFMVGVALIVAAEVHVLALLYIASISLYYLFQHVRTLRQQGQFWRITPSVYYFGGLLSAGTVYVLLHIVTDPEAYFLIARECPKCEPPGLLKEVRRMLCVFWFGEEMMLFVIAAAMAWLRRTNADAHYLVLLVGFLIALMLISPPNDNHYVTHITPLMALAVGGAFLKGSQPNGVFSRERLAIGAVIAGCMFAVRFIWLAVEFVVPAKFYGDVDYVRAYVPQDTVVMSLPEVYYELLDYDRFLSYRDGERYGILLRDEDYPTFWERERPQVFVGEPKPDDDEWWTYMHAHDFRQVRDTVWIAADLLGTISANHPIPEIAIRADQTRLAFGDCAALEWSVSDADEIELDGEEVEPAGTERVCPYETTDYRLSVYWAGGVQEQTITVQVE